MGAQFPVVLPSVPVLQPSTSGHPEKYREQAFLRGEDCVELEV
jgi:hypothetical protein